MSFNVSKSCLFFNEGSWEVRMHVSAEALLVVVESDRWDNDLCVGSALWGWTEPSGAMASGQAESVYWQALSGHKEVCTLYQR